MRVFFTSASFAPSYGGPAYSVARLAGAAARAGAEAALWAPDGSAERADAGCDAGAPLRLSGTFGSALQDFGMPDVFHDSGLWLPHNALISRTARKHSIPNVISTRGMLEPWALRHKRFKKRIAWQLYQKRNLRDASLVHATSDQELRNIERLGLRLPIRQIPNGVDIPDFDAIALGNDRDGELVHKAVFVGRLHPVKGLPMLLEAWARVRPAGWHLEIAGPDEGGHLAELQSLVSKLSLGDVVSFVGAVDAARKRALFREASLVVLPSHSESFGIAVAEGLAYGLPALATRATPWPSLLDNNCGWWVDTTVEGIEDGLRRATECSSSARKQMGRRGREMIARAYSWDQIGAQFVSIYDELRAA